MTPLPESVSVAADPGCLRADARGSGVGMVANDLMDRYRRTGAADVFDALVRLVGGQLLARVRSRLRGVAPWLDPQEVLQDAIINIYRYPGRFDASRPGAFAAWSARIVDNAIRRQLRRRRSGPQIASSPSELLDQHADVHAREPSAEAQRQEECGRLDAAFRLLLWFYLAAFQSLSERERFVLHMVEVQQKRYVEVAALLAVRPEALKMVVFRARRRILERIGRQLRRALPTPVGSREQPQALRRACVAAAC